MRYLRFFLFVSIVTIIFTNCPQDMNGVQNTSLVPSPGSTVPFTSFLSGNSISRLGYGNHTLKVTNHYVFFDLILNSSNSAIISEIIFEMFDTNWNKLPISKSHNVYNKSQQELYLGKRTGSFTFMSEYLDNKDFVNLELKQVDHSDPVFADLYATETIDKSFEVDSQEVIRFELIHSNIIQLNFTTWMNWTFYTQSNFQQYMEVMMFKSDGTPTGMKVHILNETITQYYLGKLFGSYLLRINFVYGDLHNAVLSIGNASHLPSPFPIYYQVSPNLMEDRHINYIQTQTGFDGFGNLYTNSYKLNCKVKNKIPNFISMTTPVQTFYLYHDLLKAHISCTSQEPALHSNQIYFRYGHSKLVSFFSPISVVLSDGKKIHFGDYLKHRTNLQIFSKRTHDVHEYVIIYSEGYEQLLVDDEGFILDFEWNSPRYQLTLGQTDDNVIMTEIKFKYSPNLKPGTYTWELYDYPNFHSFDIFTPGLRYTIVIKKPLGLTNLYQTNPDILEEFFIVYRGNHRIGSSFTPFLMIDILKLVKYQTIVFGETKYELFSYLKQENKSLTNPGYLYEKQIATDISGDKYIEEIRYGNLNEYSEYSIDTGILEYIETNGIPALAFFEGSSDSIHQGSNLDHDRTRNVTNEPLFKIHFRSTFLPLVLFLTMVCVRNKRK